MSAGAEAGAGFFFFPISRKFVISFNRVIDSVPSGNDIRKSIIGSGSERAASVWAAGSYSKDAEHAFRLFHHPAYSENDKGLILCVPR